jgi:hypothetical protein
MPTAAAVDKACSRADIAKAIEGGRNYLLAHQDKDGSWVAPIIPGNPIASHPAGTTALALQALLQSAYSVPDSIHIEDPPIKKGLDWLGGQKIDKTCPLALRAVVWRMALEQSGGGNVDYRGLLQNEVRLLIDSTADGSYSADAVGDKGKSANGLFDNANSAYAIQGVLAGGRANVEIPPQFLYAAMKHWLKHQRVDGGWGDDAKAGPSLAVTTANGVAAMYTCVDYLCYDVFVKVGIAPFKPLEDGLAWLDRDVARNGILAGGETFQYLDALSRVGEESGRKYFGGTDWYKAGTRWLLDNQKADGSWQGPASPTICTAYAVMFLERGMHPMLFGKLQHGGDWNNRPRAMANSLVYVNKCIEDTLAWQVEDLRAPVDQWNAPILVVTGSVDPHFSDADIEKLRTYVRRGGMILSITEGNGVGFSKAMTDPQTGLYKKLFPNYGLALLPLDHGLYSKKTQYALPADELKLSWVTNGVRPLAIHTDVDLMLPWQMKQFSDRSGFNLVTNLARFVAPRFVYLPSRGTSSWPADVRLADKGGVKIARLKYSGNCDPEPLAWERFSLMLGQEQKLKAEISKPMDIASLTGDYKLAVMTGTAAATFTGEEKDALKKYVAQGGTLFIDATGGSAEFYASVQAMVAEIWGKSNLKAFNNGCQIYKPTDKPALAIDKFLYSGASRAAGKAKNDPSLRGVVDNGRIAVIVSREDVTGGLLGLHTRTIEGYSPETAYKIMRNVVMTLGAVGASEKTAATTQSAPHILQVTP